MWVKMWAKITNGTGDSRCHMRRVVVSEWVYRKRVIIQLDHNMGGGGVVSNMSLGGTIS